MKTFRKVDYHEWTINNTRPNYMCYVYFFLFAFSVMLVDINMKDISVSLIIYIIYRNDLLYVSIFIFNKYSIFMYKLEGKISQFNKNCHVR